MKCKSGSRIGRFYGNANEYYLRDAGGRELAIFDMGTQRPKQINLFAADQTRLTDVVGQVGTADVYPGTGSISLTKQYFLKDHLGSTRVVLNDAGACFSARDYYPYGQTLREYTIGTTNRRYQFNGKERDIVTDLDYSIARYYNAKLGVWFSVDPLLDKYPGLSPYNYCLNNPVNYMDTDGRIPSDANSGFYGNKAKQTFFCVTHPAIASRIGMPSSDGNNLSSLVFRFTLRTGLPFGNGEKRNAFRHVLWQAVITGKLGKDVAKAAGDAHEDNAQTPRTDETFRGENGLSEADQAVDLLNNEIGRQ